MNLCDFTNDDHISIDYTLNPEDELLKGFTNNFTGMVVSNEEDVLTIQLCVDGPTVALPYAFIRQAKGDLADDVPYIQGAANADLK